MARKVMISCAVTGSADTPGKNPAVPVTPEQIASSCLDAAKAGAAIVHIHVRDPKTTKSTPLGFFRVQSKHLTATMDAKPQRFLPMMNSELFMRVSPRSPEPLRDFASP